MAEVRRLVAEVVPWRELTPQAQVAMKDELDRLIAQTPAQHHARMAWEGAMANPDVIPYMVKRLRELLGVEGG